MYYGLNSILNLFVSEKSDYGFEFEIIHNHSISEVVLTFYLIHNIMITLSLGLIMSSIVETLIDE